MSINIINAAKATLKYLEIDDTGLQRSFKKELHIQHQREILQAIIDGETTDDKAHRHLGWAQCALTANSIGDMNAYRAINYGSGLE